MKPYAVCLILFAFATVGCQIQPESGSSDAGGLSREEIAADVLSAMDLVADPCEVGAPPHVEGLTLIDQDTLGERAIFVLVSVLTGKDNLALLAGDGWAGDRLYRWEGDGTDKAGVTLWVSRWTEEQGAKDLDYAIMRTLEALFPERAPITLEGGERVIQTSTHVYRLARDGREVRFQVSAREFDSLPTGVVSGAS